MDPQTPLSTVTLSPRSPVRSEPAPRLVRVPGSRWSLWPAVCVRGAGFPAGLAERLSSASSAGAAARLLRERTRSPAPSDSMERSQAVAAARQAFAETFAAEMRRLRAELRDIARMPAFREAVIWQNRNAFTHAVDVLARTPVDDASSTTRKKVLLVANYLQRYCLKNDTIGFFGPVGWARFDAASSAIAVTCGPELVSTRHLYFESWCIDALAHTLDVDPDLQGWRVPYVVPVTRLEGSSVTIGARAVCELSPAHRRLFLACDGERSARAIARELQSVAADAFPTDEAVYRVLAEWQREGYIIWTFEGPLELRPEATLRARLEAIDDPALRTGALARFDALEAAMAEVRAAAGRPEALDAALRNLESTFTSVTGIAPTRGEGQVYAARTLVREDCHRAATVAIGADVLDRLGPPLSLVLQSARWILHELTARQAAEFREVFDRLASAGRGPVSLAAFVAKTSLLRNRPGTLSRVAAALRADLQQRWARVLAIPPGARRVQYRSRDLLAAVTAAFESSIGRRTAWNHYVTPDLMIDAPSLDAIARGEYQFVLGEIHVYNTLLQWLFVDENPWPGEVAEQVALDSPEPRVVWLDPKDTTPRRVQLFVGTHDVSYSATRDPSPVPPARRLRLGDLVVADAGGALVVRTRDGRTCFSCEEFFGSVMMRMGSGLFNLLPAAPHNPRVTIDDLVVSREQWQMPAAGIAFAKHRDDAERYLECQRWARDCGLPQFVFVRSPIERKPTCIDFSSPIYVNLFARLVRAAQRADPSGVVTISEMLPGPDGVWLPDANGQRYTCELRMVAVDPA